MNFYKFLVVAILFATTASAQNNKTLEVLHIYSSNREMIKFDIEVADTVEEHRKGLMYRTNMPEHQGMLFLFKKPKIVNMWMKNTYIPLDILFIDQNGVIKTIVKNATPNSLKTLSSQVSVIAALEINAMMTDKYSIKVNDVVLHPFFNNVKDINDNR